MAKLLARSPPEEAAAVVAPLLPVSYPAAAKGLGSRGPSVLRKAPIPPDPLMDAIKLDLPSLNTSAGTDSCMPWPPAGGGGGGGGGPPIPGGGGGGGGAEPPDRLGSAGEAVPLFGSGGFLEGNDGGAGGGGGDCELPVGRTDLLGGGGGGGRLPREIEERFLIQ